MIATLLGSSYKCFAGTPASSVAAASTLGFSMTDDGDPDVAEGDRAASNEDPKGLSHPRYEERSSGHVY